MADSTTPLDLIQEAQADKEVTANALFNALAGAAIFGRRDSATSGLTWGYIGGRLDGTTVAAGTVSLTGSATNYVVAHRTTLAVTVSTSTTNWNDTAVYGRVYKVVTDANSATSYEDHRVGATGILGGAAASGSDAVELVNAQTGTTYTVLDGDRSKLVTLTNASSIAVTLPQAGGSSEFVAGWFAHFQNRGAGVVTITPTTSTIDGAASITLSQHQGLTIHSDGTNYFTQRGRLTVLPVVIQLACSDETTELVAATAVAKFRMPFAMTLTAVRASLTTTSSSGNPTIDINEGGSTILSTKITIDAGELTSTTAATPPVISDASLADDAEISVDIDSAGADATGLKVTLIGNRTL